VLLKIEPEKPEGTGLRSARPASATWRQEPQGFASGGRRILEHLKEHLGKDTPLGRDQRQGRISEYKDKRLATVRTIGKGEAGDRARLSVASVNGRSRCCAACCAWLATSGKSSPRPADEARTVSRPDALAQARGAVRLLNACRQSKNTTCEPR